ncbi:G_PROTEIN_RECEP_F1_2 domain-containing protein [Caenorhabditis elegans]|uniref:G_PROTEIN_RECEP_F1_2 domain-containing protein n=1 Tax=Caenorhabditis elegans TaxID=6239 RepID=Q8ITZ5_CAEEL|nr:G_PROTEIN_RECEP_F1_2 domain-containing protein [Caenorhabditis elegans]CCD66867.2 G_PROTEIN_RECEP_F1_2 domain-containing protein [Caenorhabditis elegans]|eukprot:NP_503864.3 Serpentine Receptor, class AB (class A-like) [Caenorhabditis elegans]
MSILEKLRQWSVYQENCQTMEQLSTSLVLKFTLIFQLLSSIIAFPLLITASYCLWKSPISKSFHINVKIILQVHLIGFILHCYSRIVIHSLDLYNYMVLDYCSMPPSTIRCFVFRCQYVLGIWLVGATTLPLVLERYIATKRSSNYEYSGCTLGICVTMLQILLASVFTFYSFMNFSFATPVMTYCMAVKIGMFSNVEIIFAISLTVQIISRILFQYLFQVNQNLRLKQLASSLSNRFSLEQNMTSMRILKTFANLQAGFMIIHMAMFLYILPAGAGMEKSTYISLVEMSSSFPLYAVVSILILVRKDRLNKVKLKHSLNTHVNADQGIYFENFNKNLN